VKRKRKDIKEEINDFLDCWAVKEQIQLLRMVQDMFDLFNVTPEADWVKDISSEEDAHNIRIIRNVYLVSRIADHFSGKLCIMSAKFPALWRRMKEEVEKNPELYGSGTE